MTHLELDILCVGNAAWDVVMQIPQNPGPDEKIEADEALACGGGPASNAAVCAARLDLKAGFAGYLSHDKVGRRNRYQIQPGTHLRHALGSTHQVKSLLDVFLPDELGREHELLLA